VGSGARRCPVGVACWLAVIDQMDVDHLLRYTATTNGRDKGIRAVQYWARFYAWYLVRSGGAAGDVATWAHVKTSLGQSRKLFRVLKNIEHFKAAMRAYDSDDGKHPVVKAATVGRQLGYGAYLTLDSLTYLDALGLHRLQKQKDVQRMAYQFWALGIVCSMVNGGFQLYVQGGAAAAASSSAKQKAPEDTIAEKVSARRRNALAYQLLQDALDLTIPVSALQYLQLDDGLVGLAGLASSCMAAYTQWGLTV